MPHLQFNPEAGGRLASQYGLDTAERTAEFLGISIELVREVCERNRPSEEFIAACLLRIPARFDELFIIVEDENAA